MSKTLRDTNRWLILICFTAFCLSRALAGAPGAAAETEGWTSPAEVPAVVVAHTLAVGLQVVGARTSRTPRSCSATFSRSLADFQ